MGWPEMKPHRGTLILVLGVLSLILCAPLGVAAWMMGRKDLKLMAAGEMDPSGKDLTNIGRILGIIGTVLLVIGLVLGGLAGMVAVANAVSGKPS